MPTKGFRGDMASIVEQNHPGTARGRARRAAVLQSAAEEFIKHGYERATIGNITRTAGGSTQTIYKQFGGKPGLFSAVVQQESDRLRLELERCHLSSGELENSLLKFSRVYLEAILSPRVRAWVRIAVAEFGRFPELSRFTVKGHNAVITNLTGFLREHMYRGHISLRDPKTAATLFLAMLRGHFVGLDADLVLNQKSIAQYTKAAVELFLTASQGRREHAALRSKFRTQGSRKREKMPQSLGGSR